MKWISVEDELPKTDCMVIVAIRSTEKNTTYGKHAHTYSYPSYFDGEGHFLQVGGMSDSLENSGWKITHWQPLPSPPEDSKQSGK